MLTEKDYCDYETCVALKELGFDSLVDWYFKEDKSIASSLARYRNTYIPRISLYEAQKWLREENNIIVRIIPLYEEGKAIKGMSYTNEVIHWDNGYVTEECIEEYDSYEKALSDGIKEAVKILKEK